MAACACGCGGEVTRGKRFVRGHHRLGMTLERPCNTKETASPETVRRREEKRAWYREHRDEQLAYGIKWRAENKDKQRANYQRRKHSYRERELLAKYGINAAQFDAMRDAQGGVCLICSEPFTKMPHVDHCHATGEVRGLLCSDCNIGLGRFKDRPDRLEAAASYLRQHAQKLTITRTG
jgi:hypothetical protein